MSDLRKPTRIDTDLPFNDDLPSSSPSAKTTLIILAGMAAIIVAVTLLVVFR